MPCNSNENKYSGSCNSSCGKKCCPFFEKLKSTYLFEKLYSCPTISCIFKFFGSIFCLMIKILIFPIQLAIALFFLVLIFKSCDRIISEKEPIISEKPFAYHSYSYIYDDKNCQIEIKDGKVNVNGCKKESHHKNDHKEPSKIISKK